ncbi:helix-turn-helix domain-containing protein [Streptococcaceae bacterium ESL0687]|nr:helix-turn-helix domain-containing protein [Streptococcaceae bacterium ESL0687]
MDINKIIGKNLKRIRASKGISLASLSDLSTISKGMLSQIENGETNPTINTIWKICSGLNIPYTALLEENTEESVRVIRKSETSIQKINNDKISLFFYYGENADRNFDYFQMEIEEGVSHTSVGHSLNTEEYLMVLEGDLLMTVAGESYELSCDDVISFDAKEAHTYTNLGEGVLKLSIIIYYK